MRTFTVLVKQPVKAERVWSQGGQRSALVGDDVAAAGGNVLSGCAVAQV